MAKGAPWQFNKSMLECNKHILENELYSDVTFLVGDEDTGMKEIKAHHLILISRSPVFEAMLCGDLREKGPIKIPDTDWDTFKCFLRFLYYEDFPDDLSMILPLLYLATKYLIPTLEHKCEERLKENINIENVCLLLEQSLLYETRHLTNNCMKLIRMQTRDVVKQKSFLDINQKTLKCILEDDQLLISEPEVFECVTSWGKRQCDIADKPQTGENIRSVLGEVLYCIRFPVMTSQYLVDNVSPTCILTENEILQLLMFTQGSNSENKTKFKSTKRVGCYDILYCERFQSYGSCASWIQGGNPDAIAFKTTKDIYFRGITVSLSDDVNDKYCVIVKLYQHHMCLGAVICEQSGGLTQREIIFPDPIHLSKDIVYDIVLTISDGPDTIRGDRGDHAVTSHGVIFNFLNSHMDQNNTRVLVGQIPGILFSV